jgi:hypothetical protein
VQTEELGFFKRLIKGTNRNKRLKAARLTRTERLLKKPDKNSQINKIIDKFGFWGRNFFFILIAICLLIYAEYSFKFDLSPEATSSSIFNSNGYLTAKTVATLSKEMAFAIIIALFITFSFNWIENKERKNSLDEFAEAHLAKVDQYIAAIDSSRVKGVEGMMLDYSLLDLPKEYVSAVREQCLRNGLVRTECDLSYEICNLVLDDNLEPALRSTLQRFCELKHTVKYTIKNTSLKPIEETLRCSIPFRGADGVAERSNIVAIMVAHGEGPKDAAAYSEPEDVVKSIEDEKYKCASWVISLEPNESLSVYISTIILKEKSDSELFVSYYPTLSTKIRVRYPEGLKIGLRFTVPDGLRSEVDDGPGSRTWRIDKPMLPHQGVNLWWQTPGDDGSIATKTAE